MDRRISAVACLVFQTQDQAFQSRDIRGRGASTSEEVSKSATRAGAEWKACYEDEKRQRIPGAGRVDEVAGGGL